MDDAEEEDRRRWAAFLAIFDFTKKSKLRAHLKALTIRDRDLVDLILIADVHRWPLLHERIHRQFYPPHLELSDVNLRALGKSGVGRLSKAAQTTVNKVMATFSDRRLFSAHLFWAVENPSEWHLFYFDQRDLGGEHWVAGPHIHFMNKLTHPGIDLIALLQDLRHGSTLPKLQGLHVRYDRS